MSAAASALALFLAAPSLSFAAPATGATGREALPPDAFSLAQPEKLDTPRELQNAGSPLKLQPVEDEVAAARDEELAFPRGAVPLVPYSALLFPKHQPAVLDKPALCIRERNPLAQPPVLTTAETRARPSAREEEYFVEPVWFDSELAETAAKAEDGRTPPPAHIQPEEPSRKLDARSLLSRGILSLERDLTPEFIINEDGEAMTPAEQIQYEAEAALPQGDSAASDDLNVAEP